MLLACAVAGAALIAALAVGPATAGAAGSLALAEWEAGTCKGTKTSVQSRANCSYEASPENFYTQAAGHPPWGLTGFKLKQTGEEPNGQPVKRLRVDVPVGLAADPQALGTCEKAAFEANPKTCPTDSEAGFVELKAYLELKTVFPLLPNQVLPLKGTVYNLDLEAGKPLLFGIDVEGVPPLVKDVHLFLEGHVSYAREAPLVARGIASGDFHEWFEIDNVPPTVKVEPLGLSLAEAPLKTLESKLFFNGHAGKEGKENFLTMPSECGPPSKSTSYIELETYAPVETLPLPEQATVPPVGVDDCKEVPFKPTTTVRPQTPGYDQPDGAITELQVPQNEAAGDINTAAIAQAHALFPEGLTLNPSAAHGLETCAPAQMHFESKEAAACPAGSKVGTVNIETDLPKGSLAGGVYLAAPSGLPIKGPPFYVYIVAESIYDVKVKVEASITPDPSTGRLKVDVVNTPAHPYNLPQLPFSSATLTLDNGPRATLANPLSCATTHTESDFIAYSGEGIVKEAKPSTPFAATGCPATIPFNLTQTAGSSTNKAGAFTNFSFNLTRQDGQQNIANLTTTLPAGLAGLIPSVTLCPEPGANQGNCPAASQIGTASATAGVGSEPFGFSGPVYLTGPTGSAPYGLSIPIEAAAGPFDLGRVETRVAIGVDPHTARVIASTTLKQIQEGVPLHLRTLGVSITKPNFMFNPTNCGALSTNSAVGAIQGASTSLASPFAVTGCTGLPFKPAFAAASPSAPSRANGASLTVNLTQPAHQANIKSVMATLPKQLPSRLTTLHQACPEATWAGGNNYKSCPSGSKVGSVLVKTPVLPEPLSGPAYLVSHGGAAFPDLDLILEGDHGVRVILEGNTNIAKGITTSTFASIPDVPVSSFELKLPTGKNSALGSYGSLCSRPLYMPTVITAQSGTVIKQNTRLSIGSCKIKLLSHKIRKHMLIARVRVFTAGRLSLTGPGLHTTYKKVGGPGVVTIKARFSNRARRSLAHGRPFRFRLRAGFNPRHKGEYHSAAFAKVTFKH